MGMFRSFAVHEVFLVKYSRSSMPSVRAESGASFLGGGAARVNKIANSYYRN